MGPIYVLDPSAGAGAKEAQAAGPKTALKAGLIGRRRA
jgi:hypothetical protein